MLCHPAFLFAQVACDSESQAFFAQQDVSAVTGVNRPDGVVFRKMHDVSIVLIDIFFAVQAFGEISAVAEFI